MDLKSIAIEICDQADDFLAGVRRRDEARAGVAEYLTIHHLKMLPDDKKAVIDQVMRILSDEGFFEASTGSGTEDGASSLEEM